LAKNLTKKQAMFAAEYLTDFNATRAAIAAGYSKKTATEQGARLLTNVKVAEQIEKKLGKRLGKLEISADKVLQELAKLAFYDPINFFEDDGSLKRLQDLDEHTRMALAGIEVTELFEGKDVPDGAQQKTVYGLVKKIKLADKGVNLERLGRYLKLFTDKVEHSGKVTLESLVCGSADGD
jgi:phage terminase small subunit